MTFWILAALLTGAMLVLLLRPLLVPREAEGIQSTDVYKAQLAEIEREAARGLISQEDASSARTEIGRRILRATERETASSDGRLRDPRTIAIALAGFVVAASLGGYFWLGQPGMPGQPFAARDLTAERDNRLGPAAQELERRLAALDDPADRALLLGDAFAELGGLDEAESAYLNALSHRPDDPDILTRLGEVDLRRGQGLLSSEARDWFDQALAAAPNHPAANFYRALYDFQQGNYAEAESRLTELLAAAPEGAEWTTQVTSLLFEVQSTADQVGALTEMSDADRETMIRNMVEQLAARLEESPGDFDGWLRLANAYSVLGDQEAAQNALSRARALARGEPVLEARVREIADSLSLE